MEITCLGNSGSRTAFFPAEVVGFTAVDQGRIGDFGILAIGHHLWAFAYRFPTTPGAFDRIYGGGLCWADQRPCLDAFLAKVEPDGSALVYATYLGTAQEDFADSLAVDLDRNPIVLGRTQAADFPTTPGAFDTSFAGGTCGTFPDFYTCRDAFVTKLQDYEPVVHRVYLPLALSTH